MVPGKTLDSFDHWEFVPRLTTSLKVTSAFSRQRRSRPRGDGFGGSGIDRDVGGNVDGGGGMDRDVGGDGDGCGGIDHDVGMRGSSEADRNHGRYANASSAAAKSQAQPVPAHQWIQRWARDGG